MPTRVQRKRSKGFKLPPNTICCTRPGKFSNPFTVTTKMRPGVRVAGVSGYYAVSSAEDSLACFREYVAEILKTDPHWLDELRSADYLACWCPLDAVCHVDILIELLQREK